MRQNRIRKNTMRGLRRALGARAGFALLELLIALGVLGVLAGAVTPLVISRVRLQAAQTTAQDLAAVADASRAFCVAQFPNSRWPTGFNELMTAGYLPSGFSAQNPFGQAYTMGIAGQRLQLGTTVPTNLATAVTRLLPLSSEAGGVVTTEYPIPGQSSDLTEIEMRLTAVEGAVAQLRVDVDQLRVDVNALTVRMGSAEIRLTAVEGRVTTLEGRVDVLRTDVDNLTARVVEEDWAGQIVLSAGSCPTGWTRFVAADGQFLMASGSAGTTGGQTTYSHNHPVSLSGTTSGTVSGTTQTSPLVAEIRAGDLGTYLASHTAHAHSFTSDEVTLPVNVGGTTDSVNQDIVPPFYTVVLCQRNAWIGG